MRPHTQTASTVKSAHFEKMLHINKLGEKLSYEEQIMRPWILQTKDYLILTNKRGVGVKI